jgi:hypothetical protein
MNYKSMLYDFLLKSQNRKYAAQILAKLTGQHRHGPIALIRREEAFADKIHDVIEYLVNDAINNKRYTVSIIPTVVSPELAPNFWFRNEKEPTENEVYRYLYILLTGLYQGNYVVNLDNVDTLTMENFRDFLVKKAILLEDEAWMGINIKKVLLGLGIRKFPLTEFGFSLLMVSYFVSWIKERTHEDLKWIEKINTIGLSSALTELGIEDTIALVTFNIHKQKKEMHITPRLKDFVIKWYENFLAGKEEHAYFLSFLSSIYVTHKNYRKVADPLMNKFIYYLLRGYVNGELLGDIVNLKIKYELKENIRPFPIQRVNEFLAKLG